MGRGVIIGIFALALIAVVGFVRLVMGTPPVVLVAAVVPAICYSGLVVLIDRYEQEPSHLLLATFLWGAVIAAFLSSTGNDLFHTWAVGVMGEGETTVIEVTGHPQARVNRVGRRPYPVWEKKRVRVDSRG
jgi:RsiW-degrading membrane proteinase PrsW (M82 family)